MCCTRTGAASTYPCDPGAISVLSLPRRGRCMKGRLALSWLQHIGACGLHPWEAGAREAAEGGHPCGSTARTPPCLHILTQYLVQWYSKTSSLTFVQAAAAASAALALVVATASAAVAGAGTGPEWSARRGPVRSRPLQHCTPSRPLRQQAAAGRPSALLGRKWAHAALLRAACGGLVGCMQRACSLMAAALFIFFAGRTAAAAAGLVATGATAEIGATAVAGAPPAIVRRQRCVSAAAAAGGQCQRDAPAVEALRFPESAGQYSLGCRGAAHALRGM